RVLPFKGRVGWGSCCASRADSRRIEVPPLRRMMTDRTAVHSALSTSSATDEKGECRMISNASAIFRAPASRRSLAEDRFYVGFSIFMFAGFALGFARTFFLRAWFPEWTQAHAAPEPYFLFHGFVFVTWLVLMMAQPTLVAAGRVDLHRRVGVF